ncbi:MAG: ribonuclease III [Deltaproteobacteria bacterium]|nr:ribonuclease III [Deltaproteobacteria bacterium]
MDIRRTEKERLKEFQKRFGYAFKHLGHLTRALMHRSYANECRLPATEHNERYEYLGDAVLELAISHLLMAHFPDHPEGDLSKLRAAVVNETQLAQLARAVNLGDYLYLGKGEEQTGGRDKPSLLADCFEAILGAIYLDRGFPRALAVVERHYLPILREASACGELIRDFKTKLQEEVQRRFRIVPRYRLLQESGPDHHKTFHVQLLIGPEAYGMGMGSSKKAAEQEAARSALHRLGCL